MNKENLSYWTLTTAQWGVTLYEATNAIGGVFPNSENFKLLALSFATSLTTILFRNFYKYPSLSVLGAVPLLATAFIESSNYATENLTSFDHKVIFGTILFCLTVNLVNMPGKDKIN